jgi:hypothetical protein
MPAFLLNRKGYGALHDFIGASAFYANPQLVDAGIEFLQVHFAVQRLYKLANQNAFPQHPRLKYNQVSICLHSQRLSHLLSIRYIAFT